MIDYQKNSLIVLPHLDDEFALIPIIKKFTSISNKNLTFIYCAEKNNNENLKKIRREENKKALDTLDCQKGQVIYLNDFFPVDDLELIDSSSEIYYFIKSFLNKNKFKQIITLSFEGGHPDHDSLALIINKISDRDKSFNIFFVPAYNSRRTFMIPVSVFRPLKSQLQFFTKENFQSFFWVDALKIAIIYKSERLAFIKLLPFILFKLFFSKSIYISHLIQVESVDWEESLSLRRYSVKWHTIIKKINNL